MLSRSMWAPAVSPVCNSQWASCYWRRVCFKEPHRQMNLPLKKQEANENCHLTQRDGSTSPSKLYWYLISCLSFDIAAVGCICCAYHAIVSSAPYWSLSFSVDFTGLWETMMWSGESLVARLEQSQSLLQLYRQKQRVIMLKQWNSTMRYCAYSFTVHRHAWNLCPQQHYTSFFSLPQSSSFTKFPKCFNPAIFA